MPRQIFNENGGILLEVLTLSQFNKCVGKSDKLRFGQDRFHKLAVAQLGIESDFCKQVASLPKQIAYGG